MQRLIKFPLVFLFIAALIGLALRWHYYQPMTGFTYPYWLHAHSHLMFLGWVFNALSIGYVICFLPEELQSWYKKPFYIINLLVLGMLITFPIQGYGVYSIVVSTLHTMVVIVVSIRFFKDTNKKKNDNAVWFARTSLLFFIISAFGPFVVGALAANGLGQSDGYYLSIYYYLHFQYNGVFTFGIFAFFFYLLKQKGVYIDLQYIKKFRWILFISCFPAYALSTLWTSPPMFVYILALLGALGQLIALYYLLQSMRSHWIQFISLISPLTRVLLIISLIAFVLKLILQLFSVHPSVAMLAYERRFYVIAYLHLVLIGMISLFLIAWYNEQRWITLKRIYVYLLIIGFVTSELVMISVGQWPGLFNIQEWMIITSIILVIGITGIVIGGIRMTNKRSHSYQKVNSNEQ